MNTWALVLAGGEGQRLERLTTDSGGRRIPKQYWSLDGGASLLEDALARAETVCIRDHVCISVTEQQRQWWAGPLQQLPTENIVIQPKGCGTAHGILLPLLHIVSRDPMATVLVLPSDHYVRDEAALCRTMRRAAAEATSQSDQVFLLGIEPDEADPELGYVVATPQPGQSARAVHRFVEKPKESIEINRLIREGAMWNSFIFSASASVLIRLFENQCAATLASMRAAMNQDRQQGTEHAMRELYRTLPNVDFCKDMLAGQEARLRLLPVPWCGWSDLGTPIRVERALRRLGRRHRSTLSGERASGALVLRDQVDRLTSGMRANAE